MFYEEIIQIWTSASFRIRMSQRLVQYEIRRSDLSYEVMSCSHRLTIFGLVCRKIFLVQFTVTSDMFTIQWRSISEFRLFHSFLHLYGLIGLYVKFNIWNFPQTNNRKQQWMSHKWGCSLLECRSIFRIWFAISFTMLLSSSLSVFGQLKLRIKSDKEERYSSTLLLTNI